LARKSWKDSGSTDSVVIKKRSHTFFPVFCSCEDQYLKNPVNILLPEKSVSILQDLVDEESPEKYEHN
jgi:hypothetical protein